MLSYFAYLTHTYVEGRIFFLFLHNVYSVCILQLFSVACSLVALQNNNWLFPINMKPLMRDFLVVNVTEMHFVTIEMVKKTITSTLYLWVATWQCYSDTVKQLEDCILGVN